jgi:succinate-acetate transporter protein
MISQSEVVTLIAYVYDGLFKGGIIVMVAEISAEVGYPVGEATTYGLLTSMEFGITWVFAFTMQLLVSPILDKDEQITLNTKYLPVYVFLLVIYALMTLAAMFITYRFDPVLHRYLEDKVDAEEEEDYIETEKDTAKLGGGEGNITMSDSFQLTTEE